MLTIAIAFFAAAAFLLPSLTTALMPYNPLSAWDMMFPADDPLKVLEQSPLAAARSLDDNALALARADWRETAAEHQISLDIPGMKKEDVKIEVEEEKRVLRVSGERKAEEEVKDERWHRVERTVGKFWRQFRLPANADMGGVRARLDDGVLRITVPKSTEQEVKKEAKVIAIDEKKSSPAEDVVNPATKKEL